MYLFSHLKPSNTENHILQSKPSTLCSLTHFCVDLLEGSIILIYLKVDFCCGDGEGSFGHHHRSNELGRGAENHRACKTGAVSQSGPLWCSYISFQRVW